MKILKNSICYRPVHKNAVHSGSCMVNIVAATDHRVKYINRSVIIFGDHRRRLRRAAETWNKYPFPYSNVVGRIGAKARVYKELVNASAAPAHPDNCTLIYNFLLLFEWDLLIPRGVELVIRSNEDHFVRLERPLLN